MLTSYSSQVSHISSKYRGMRFLQRYTPKKPTLMSLKALQAMVSVPSILLLRSPFAKVADERP
jgi:hypothetical protein